MIPEDASAAAQRALDTLAWATLSPSLFAQPFRMQPGLQRMPPGVPIFTPLDPAGPVFREKLAALGAPDGDALLVAGGDGELQARAWHSLAQAVLAQHPQRFCAPDGPRFGLADKLLGWSVEWPDASGAPAVAWQQAPPAHAVALPSVVARFDPQLRPWALLALALHDDIALLRAPEGRLELLAVALPSHWAPRDKIGRSFAQVHRPVADNALLLRAADALVDLVCKADAGERWQRFVWALTPLGQYDAHPARCAPRVWPDLQKDEESSCHIWLRFERQCFLPLPATPAAALFAIRVHMLPLDAVLARADLAQALHASLASMSEAALAYKGMAAARAGLLRRIGRCLSASATAAAG